MDKILITGAGGNLGSGVTGLLKSRHQLILSDIVSINTNMEFYQADVSKPGALDRASEGVDTIVHTAALHGYYTSKRSERDFFNLNMTGTFEMFQSAIRNQVRKVIWISSMDVYRKRTSVYSYTKIMGEELCKYFHKTHGLEVIILRPDDFVPTITLRDYGEKLLNWGVDRRDVIESVNLAVHCKQKFGIYNIIREDPFSMEDIRKYPLYPIEIWNKVYPGAKRIIKKHNMKYPNTIQIYDLSREKKELGYLPKQNFGSFLKEYTRGGTIVES
ncbi:NAD-dependent epimerase/dehydratase family protein [Alkalihalobacterium elongatum]|uniref:NAD-dependent epimerase/dehydratase family protein n=1 Tax=Alkalihalobacterium elongatum TaxID=2675466 RepID=UPI001C1F5564|nr:NAD(P)-dependent oxidoreductase [Alkalihalobacterium elongatum]